MATLVIEQVPDELYRALEERAATHRRSVNDEAIVCLERVLKPQPLDVERWLATTHKLGQGAAGFELTEELLRDAKDEGRP
ncbi:MAG: DNA-binding protein [Acidobacteriota bacterium]